MPAIDRIGILLIGPAGGDQIQVMTALGGAATAAYAETVESALERLRRDDLDVALITGSRDHDDLQRLCAAIRSDIALFDLPVLLIGRPDAFPDRALPFHWGVSDVLFQPFQPEVLRLRVQGWVRQQRLRRRLRGCLDSVQPPPTTDRLTRLFGHGFLHGYVEHLIAQNLRAQTPLAVASFDVAGMGQINRLHGYAVGDRVLAQIGAMIARISRAEDLPARLRDDRFCLVIDGASAAEAAGAGERIAEILTGLPVQTGAGQSLRLAMMTGIAELDAGRRRGHADRPRLRADGPGRPAPGLLTRRAAASGAGGAHAMCWPPLTERVEPVMKPASSAPGTARCGRSPRPCRGGRPGCGTIFLPAPPPAPRAPSRCRYSRARWR